MQLLRGFVALLGAGHHQAVSMVMVLICFATLWNSLLYFDIFDITK